MLHQNGHLFFGRTNWGSGIQWIPWNLGVEMLKLLAVVSDLEIGKAKGELSGSHCLPKNFNLQLCTPVLLAQMKRHHRIQLEAARADFMIVSE